MKLAAGNTSSTYAHIGHGGTYEPMEKSCQWMIAFSLPCVIESVEPLRRKDAWPEINCSREGFAP